MIRAGGLALLAVLGSTMAVAAQSVTLVAGGDVEWSRDLKLPDAYYDKPEDPPDGEWMRIPFVYRPETVAYLKTLGVERDTMEAHHNEAIRWDQLPRFASIEDDVRYPFERVAPTLRDADLAFVNLENPLSNGSRHTGAFMAPAELADALRWAGIDMVSVANNHALDADGQGLLDTVESLWRAGVGSAGGGRDLADARRPFVIERNGVKIALLGYTQFVNGGAEAFATPTRSGVVPMDPLLMKEDIARIRDQVDHVVISIHWGFENVQETHPDQRAFAHDLIDAGADIILGHHPHVPRGVEVYRGGVIFYSFGNLIFGHGHNYWMDNYLARLHLAKDQVTRVEILPVAGAGTTLAQPFLLAGDQARAVLDSVRTMSAELDTEMNIDGDVGIIEVGPRRTTASPAGASRLR